MECDEKHQITILAKYSEVKVNEFGMDMLYKYWFCKYFSIKFNNISFKNIQYYNFLYNFSNP